MRWFSIVASHTQFPCVPLYWHAPYSLQGAHGVSQNGPVKSIARSRFMSLPSVLSS